MTQPVLPGCWCRCWWQVSLSALPQPALTGLTGRPQDSLGAAVDRRITSLSANHAPLRAPLPVQSRAWAVKPVQLHVQGGGLSLVRVPPRPRCASQHEPASIMLRRLRALGAAHGQAAQGWLLGPTYAACCRVERVDVLRASGMPRVPQHPALLVVTQEATDLHTSGLPLGAAAGLDCSPRLGAGRCPTKSIYTISDPGT